MFYIVHECGHICVTRYSKSKFPEDKMIVLYYRHDQCCKCLHYGIVTPECIVHKTGRGLSVGMP